MSREPTSSAARLPGAHDDPAGAQVAPEGAGGVATVAPARAEALDDHRPAAPVGARVAPGEADAGAAHGPQPPADPGARPEAEAQPPSREHLPRRDAEVDDPGPRRRGRS